MRFKVERYQKDSNSLGPNGSQTLEADSPMDAVHKYVARYRLSDYQDTRYDKWRFRVVPLDEIVIEWSPPSEGEWVEVSRS